MFNIRKSYYKFLKILKQKYNNKKINLNFKSHYIKYFEQPIDISVIEIKDSVKINKEDIKYLYYDINYKIGGYLKYKEMDILSLGNPLRDKLSNGIG